MPRKQRFKPSRKPKQPEPIEQNEATVSNAGQRDAHVDDAGKSRSDEDMPGRDDDMARSRDHYNEIEPDLEDDREEPSH